MRVTTISCDRCGEILEDGCATLIDQAGNTLHHLCDRCRTQFREFLANAR